MEDKDFLTIKSEISSSAALISEMAIQPISLDLQRKYIEKSKGFELSVTGRDSRAEGNVAWLEIKQIGRPVNDGPEQFFSAMQKILQSCKIPHTKLLFLIGQEDGKFTMFLGFKSSGKVIPDINAFSEFAKGCWAGLKCSPVDNTPFIDQFKENMKKHTHIKAITGIPSIKTKYDTYFASTIDPLLSGMLNKEFYYLVIAEPIETEEIEEIESNILTLNGSLESLKTISTSVSDSESQQLPQAYRDNLSFWEKTKVAGTLLFKALPIISNPFSPAVDTYLQKYLTPPTTLSTNKTLNISIVNKHVEATEAYLERQLERFRTCEAMGAWRTGVYIISKDESTAVSGASQISAIASGCDSYLEPLRVVDINNMNIQHQANSFGVFDNPITTFKIEDTVYHNHFGAALDGLMTVLSTEELSYFVNFPLRSVPGISVIDSSPDFNLNKIDGDSKIPFGKLIFGGSETELDYSIDPLTLSRHALVAGINGSGKTNTILSIVKGLQERIPFLIIEPAKTEYVDWAREYNKKAREAGKEEIKIYIPGCNKYRGELIPEQLRLNPFEIIWLDEKQEPNILAHIDRLKSVFAAAFPMTDILPVLMEDLIYTVYQAESTNWIGKYAEPKYRITPFPTLNSMSVYVDKVISHRKYEEKVQMNMEACLNTRIDSLKRGWRGSLLNCTHSTEWHDLFEKPAIINLSYVGDDTDKAFIMSLILQFLYEYCSAKAELGHIDFNSNECRHMTIIEEAHRVMARCDNPELPQYKSSMLFSNMLSEIRAYGESMFLVDQVPTRLIPDALKNTNLKITHRIVAEDDCRAMGEAMGLSEDQRKMIPKLLTGQSIVSSASDTNAYWVKVNKMK